MAKKKTKDSKEYYKNLITQHKSILAKARGLAVSSMLESGKVLFPEKAAYMTDMEAELLTFPYAPHDDMVDSLTQFLNWIKSKNTLKPNIRRL